MVTLLQLRHQQGQLVYLTCQVNNNTQTKNKFSRRSSVKKIGKPTPVAVNPKSFLILYLFLFFISEKAKELSADKIVDSLIRKGVAIFFGNRLVKGPSFANYQDLVGRSKEETGGFTPMLLFVFSQSILNPIFWEKVD